jgi:hypothetical protein
MPDVKTYVRIDLDTKTLDEIDRLSLKHGLSRSDYIAMLVEKRTLQDELQPLRDLEVIVRDILGQTGYGYVARGELSDRGARTILQRLDLLRSCQPSEVASPGSDPQT